MDEEGIVADKRRLTVTQKKMYKNQHRVCGTQVDALPHAVYMKIVDKSTVKSIYVSLFSTYEGNQQVKEAMANPLVHQYELFRMKKDEDIEAIHSRFETLISCQEDFRESSCQIQAKDRCHSRDE